MAIEHGGRGQGETPKVPEAPTPIYNQSKQCLQSWNSERRTRSSGNSRIGSGGLNIKESGISRTGNGGISKNVNQRVGDIARILKPSKRQLISGNSRTVIE
jgi:hypothetical protein